MSDLTERQYAERAAGAAHHAALLLDDPSQSLEYAVNFLSGALSDARRALAKRLERLANTSED